MESNITKELECIPYLCSSLSSLMNGISILLDPFEEGELLHEELSKEELKGNRGKALIGH